MFTIYATKFHVDEILLHAPVTFGEAWNCPVH